MNIITYLFILGILALIVEVLSIALKITGLDIDKARFQVISIITNTGFTTKESELITQHPTRRKIAQILMLVSYIGYATIIGLVVNILQSDNESITVIIGVLSILFVLLIFIRYKWLGQRLERLIERQLLKRMNKISKFKSVEEVLKLNDEYGVAEFVIEEDCRLVGLSLLEAGLTKENIQILNIDRGSHIIHFPKSNFIFQSGDKVIVYGNLDNIKKLVIEQYTDKVVDITN